MTIVKGEIESLKRIREKLYENGIYRFNSLGELKTFLKKYESEKLDIIERFSNDVDLELQKLRHELPLVQEEYANLQKSEKSKLNLKIASLNSKLSDLTTGEFNVFSKVFIFFKQKRLKGKISRLNRNFDKLVNRKSKALGKQIDEKLKLISNYSSNKEQEVEMRSHKKIKDLDKIREIVVGLEFDIAGAIGENRVVKTIQRLSDDNILINDFRLRFNPPLHNKKKRDKIFSVQIDHLLITPAGIFILETKNWSKSSIQNLNLRSPVEQIQRAGYALFVILNSKTKSRSKFHLNKHHWGRKQIPIRNVIVMINNKPAEQFKFVSIKKIDELNSYLSHFDPVLEVEEINSIYTYLDSIRD